MILVITIVIIGCDIYLLWLIDLLLRRKVLLVTTRKLSSLYICIGHHLLKQVWQRRWCMRERLFF